MQKKIQMRLNIGGRLREWSRPVVMGIVNVTPDSFYGGSRVSGRDALLSRVGKMLEEGADIIDIGGYSSRSGADEVDAHEEIGRLKPAVELILHRYPDTIISVDTFRASVASECIEAGAHIINDISGGDLDGAMFDTAARLRVPYILMHMRGNPSTMQSNTDYDDVTAEVLQDLALKADRLRQRGVADVIVDPGFGFAKTLDQNYELLGNLDAFHTIGPVLAGVSRKSMIYKLLDISPEEALNGTTALNMLALSNGADILRVHDVKAAVETVRIFEAYRRNRPNTERVITVIDRGGDSTIQIY